MRPAFAIDRSEVFEKALNRQGKSANNKRIDQKYYNLGQHSFTKEMREYAYNWFETNLNYRGNTLIQ